MMKGSARHVMGRMGGVAAGAIVALAIEAAIDARQAQAPAQPPAPTKAASAARASEGPVRGASGAIIGFTNLAEIPGTTWRIHDAARPHPRVVTPGAGPGAAPSDAIALFDGKDLSKW